MARNELVYRIFSTENLIQSFTVDQLLVELLRVFLVIVALYYVVPFVAVWKVHSLDLIVKFMQLPGPRRFPIVGIALEVIILNVDAVLDYFKYLIDAYPRLCAVWVLGVPLLMFTDPDDLEVVMGSSQYIQKGMEYYPLLPWLNEGLLTSTGDKWHRRRKMLTPTFHFRILEDCLPTFNKNSRLLTKKMLTADGKPFNIDMLVTNCTLDVICESAMGISLKDEGQRGVDYVNAIKGISECVVKRILSLWLYKEWFFFVSSVGKQFRKYKALLHDFSQKVIDDRRSTVQKEVLANGHAKTEDDEEKSEKKRRAFLDLLLEIEAKNPGSLSDIDIREEVDTFMFEGHDTTSAAICFALFFLGSIPDVQEKAFAEQEEIFGDSDRSATLKDLQQMSYLEKVIKETLRVYPSVPYISRMLTKDLVLKDKTVIPDGVNVVILPYFVHRNEKYFPDPEKFDPERFSEDENAKRHPFAYIPFSAGPRNCIGQKFAMMELKVVLSTVIRQCRIESVTKREDIKVSPLLILRTEKPIYLKAFPRQQAA